MALLGQSIVVRGELHSTEDLVIEGQVEGPIWSDGMSVVVAATASITGDIVARAITIRGRVAGALIASDRVHLTPTATVTGRVVASSFVLQEGASFTGAVQPQHLDAALRVARHRHEQG